MTFHFFSRHWLFASLLFVGSSALAQQYSWIDENGFKQFSDQPPPASTPKNKIMRGYDPARATESAAPATADGAASDTAAETTKKNKSIAEQEMAFNKQRAAQAAEDKKNREEASQLNAKKENCSRMTDYQRTLNSDERIRQTGADGERSYMSDEKRAEEQRSLQKKMQDCNN